MLRRVNFKIKKLRKVKYNMIRVTSIRRCHTADYDEIYLIVRSIASLERSKSTLLKNATQLIELSPSKTLFYNYLNWDKSGIWNEDTFKKLYEPAFLEELNNNNIAQELLKTLEMKDKANKKIALLCFCSDENTCHRKTVGEILRNRGCNVIFDCDTKRGI